VNFVVHEQPRTSDEKKLCGVSCGFNLMGQPKEGNNEQEARRRGDQRRGRQGRWGKRLSIFFSS
jgi:hypothetical protein